ncbi:MAG TPA: SDR family oxidoreductase [Rhizomicrobium sp.]|nr:SDR family oxidoreductase [Rhizomicrobium sp.]
MNVLITGANRGIGFELARQYARDGASVLACCRSPQAADGLKALAGEAKGRVSIHAMDVADENSIRAAAGKIGEQAIDILINNAGISGGKNQSLDNIDTADWLRAFQVMSIGPFRVVQAFLPSLRRAENPRIVTVTSQIGASTWGSGGIYVYASAKAAVNRTMQSLARDLKDEAIVALVHPGWVRTDMGGANADISPEESAAGIRKLVARLTRADSGKFYKWNGDIHPW